MTRYILNYAGGSKGDFLCNFLNGYDIRLDAKRKSSSNHSYFKTLRFEDFDQDRARASLAANAKIYPGHCCYKIPERFLRENDLKIIDFRYEEKYHRTITIELAFKSLTEILDKISKIRMLSYYDIEVSKKSVDSIVYYLDIFLLKEGLTIDDENRSWRLDEDLRSPRFEYQTARDESIFDYGKIFFHKDFESISKIFDIDESTLSHRIDLTWLPEQVDLFGREWYPESYGYRHV